MHYKGVLGELAAMLRGPKHIKDFEEYGCNYWKEWADDDGSICVDYGNSWLDFGGYRQLQQLVEGLKNDPHGRRHIVTGRKPDNLDILSLPCCHLLYQWYVREDEFLDMIWYQRSADWMIGVPSDIVLAAAWNIIIANEVGLKPGKITMVFGDSHIYAEHYKATEVYLEQFGKTNPMILPEYKLLIDEGRDHKLFTPEWFDIIGYHPQDAIKFQLKA